METMHFCRTQNRDHNNISYSARHETVGRRIAVDCWWRTLVESERLLVENCVYFAGVDDN